MVSGRSNLVRAVIVGAVIALVGAACSGDDSTGAASDTGTDTSSEGEGPVVAEEAAEGLLTDDEVAAYLEEAALVPLAGSDAAAPPQTPDGPSGASGYSRYVFRETSSGDVLTSLVEGPLGEQTRCQDVDLPCSFEDLRELAQSGDPIPPELGLTRDEVEQLVAELTLTNAAIEHYADPSTACAEGFRSDRTQTPNMGSHFFNPGRLTDGEFNPAEPEIIMYALADGAAPTGQLGQCEGDRWVGAPLEAVAAAFILWTGSEGDHPEGFTGSFDNWHVHYNLCRGAGTDSIVTREQCESSGGTYYETLGWMMHAWASTAFDNQLGVFSMWNPTLWPVTDPESVHSRSTSAPPDLPDDGGFLPIENFAFGTVEAGVGAPVVIANSDSVAHTVTSGSASDAGEDFDSGVFAPGEYFELTFDEAGQYSFFCTLHPDMQGRIIVE